MKFIVGIFFLILLACATPTPGQATPCPKFVLIGPADVIGLNETVSFEVKTKDSKTDLTGVSVEWTVSAGLIVTGQGTPSIKYQSHVTDWTKVTTRAAVRANGCKSLRTGVWTAIGPIKDEFPIDEFGKQSRRYLQARIDNFYTQLSNNPSMEGAVMVRFDTNASSAYKKSWMERFLACLAFRKYDPSRITFLIEKDSGDERTMFTMPAPEPIDFDSYTVIKGDKIRAKLKNLFR